MLMSGSGLLLASMSGFMVLMQLWSLLISMAPDTTKDRKDMSVQNCPCPTLVAASLGRTGPAPH